MTSCPRVKVEVRLKGVLTGRSPRLCLKGCRQVEEVVRVHRLVRSVIGYHTRQKQDTPKSTQLKYSTAVQGHPVHT